MEPYDAEFRGEVLAACDTSEERARLRSVSRFRNRGCGGSSSNVARPAKSRRRPRLRVNRNGTPGPIG